MTHISETAGKVFRQDGGTVASAAVAFIKPFEGFSAISYRCPAGVWSIGYGTTRYPEGCAVAAGEGPVTEETASGYLEHDVAQFSRQLLALLKRTATLHQSVAMLSLAYNTGIGNFSKSSVLRNFNQGKILSAGDAFLLWNKVHGVVSPGLKRRREAERRLFLKA